MKANKGFTLIELLVVISIIGLISTIVLASLSSAKNKAKRAKVKSDINLIRDAIIIAQGESNMTLRTITGNSCTFCSAGGINVPGNPASVKTSLQKIALKAGGVYDQISDLTTDPWGNTYVLDENEGEYVTPYCRYDILASKGPNGVFESSYDTSYVGGDDIKVVIPFISPPCSQ